MQLLLKNKWFFIRLLGSDMFTATLNLVTHVSDYCDFLNTEGWKSFFINVLASNSCFNYRNIFHNGVNALSEKVDAFLSKSSKFYLVSIANLTTRLNICASL